jgi:CheY-like chemotaxis protein
MYIFLAEDNPADVYLLREALSASGNCAVLHVASDGEEAIRFIEACGASSAAPLPDLIILDLNLPKNDGTDLLRTIRTKQLFAPIPVVILTSSDSPRDRSLAERLGADAYFTKPSDLDAFLDVVRELLSYVGVTPRRRFAQGTA